MQRIGFWRHLHPNPVRAALIPQSGYSNSGWLYRVFGMERRGDFKTPAAYIAEHAAPDDAVLVIESREYYSYLGPAVDYWLQSYDLNQAYYDGEKLRDKYVLTPVVTSRSQLDEILAVPGRTWLVVPDYLLRAPILSDEINEFIHGSSDRIVYVGGDGGSKVYLFE